MSVEQAVFALAGTVCIVAAVTAVSHRDPRTAAAAFLFTLLSLTVLYAGLGAPAVAGLVIVVALFTTVPFVVHLTVPAARAQIVDGPAVVGGAMLLGAALLVILAVAIAFGEIPVNVSVRSNDGYDMAALGDIVAGRAAVAAGGSVLLLVAASAAAWTVRRSGRRSR